MREPLTPLELALVWTWQVLSRVIYHWPAAESPELHQNQTVSVAQDEFQGLPKIKRVSYSKSNIKINLKKTVADIHK